MRKRKRKSLNTRTNYNFLLTLTDRKTGHVIRKKVPAKHEGQAIRTFQKYFRQAKTHTLTSIIRLEHF